MIDRSKFIANSIFTVYRDIFHREIELLEIYMLDTADKLEDKSRELRQAYSAELEEYQIDAWEHEYFNYALNFPKILFPSVLIAEQTILEKTLFQIVEKLKQIFSKELSKRKNESTISYYSRNLFRVFEIHSANNPDQIKRLEEFNTIRNRFAHSNGSFNHLSETQVLRIRRIAEESGEKLLINESLKELIIYDVQWLIDYASLMKTFLDPVFDEIIKKHMVNLKDAPKHESP